MRRIAVEVLICAVAAVIVAMLVLAAGRAIDPPMALPGRPIDPALGDSVAGGRASCVLGVVTGPAATGDIGTATLCYDGRDLCAVLRVGDLTPGVLYTAWLGHTLQPTPCQDARCGPVDPLGERQSGQMQQVAQGVATSAGTLDLEACQRNVQLTSGTQVSLVLLRPGGRAGPHAQAALIVP